MDKYWKIRKIAENSQLTSLEINPVIRDLLLARGIDSGEKMEDFFSSDYDDLHDPSGFKGMKEAVERISQARKSGEKIAIFGDYDADGVTATALLYGALKDLGFSDIAYYIPDRQLEGYGMNDKAIGFLAEDGVKLVITVDCGITNVSEVEKAKSLGIDVIITDHHNIPEHLPEAVAVINPHIEDSGFPFRNLAGVGVAFKLATALYASMAPLKIDQLKWMLDLVCIGTIADCVELLGENRIFVKYGLIVLSKTKRAGLQEMFKVGRIDISEDNVPDAHRVAFQIAPRINAAGRMDHASVSYKLIIESDPVIARDMALDVEKKNQERQKVTGQIVKEIEMIATNSFKDKRFIFVANEHWPVGILGLVAGKITDQFQKPTAVLQKQDKEYVGSLRSVPEVNIMDALRECSDILIRFGGHAQAAGVRVSHENIEKFYEHMSEAVEKRMAGREAFSCIDIDSEIDPASIDPHLVSEIRRMEPFGMGNSEPVFVARGMTVKDVRVVGNGSKHLKMTLGAPGNGNVFDSIGFGLGDKFPSIPIGSSVDAVFNIQEDGWNGNRKIQFRIIDLKVN
ncbi:MAG: single-stranded-DNA-specific exonuclease RecJ [Candidatus Moranbacteria bacterium]|nr:single-stranded-DNA-specific exonuclease RecJ [Candidatus Moranbacteria bacterium]